MIAFCKVGGIKISVIRFLFQRVLSILITSFGVVTLSFFLIHLTPGDPVDVLLGEYALPTDRDEMRSKLGLDKPVGTQYTQYLVGLMQGDLGESLTYNKSVSVMIAERFPATAQLALVAILFAIVVSFPLGVWAAQHKDGWQDVSVRTFSMAAFSMPSFWLGPLMMIVFALWLDMLPISGRDGWASVIMPAIALGVTMAAILARLIRTSLLESLGSDYIRTAEAKGVKARSQLWKHALKNAMLPVVTVLFLQMGALLTGAILTEAVFSWPGVGGLIVDAIGSRDYPLIQGCVLFIALVYMLMTFLSDLFYALIDPRVRVGGEMG